MHTITQLREELRSPGSASSVTLRAQIEELSRKTTKTGKPYYEAKLRDAQDALALKAWDDTPVFAFCEESSAGDSIELTGEFVNGNYGLEARTWTARHLSASEKKDFFASAGSATDTTDLHDIETLVSSIADPRLAALCRKFLDEFGERFARAAAARHNHHARRGGLLAHSAQMMRVADAVSRLYPQMLNRDLLLAGALLHDCGKLWETCPAAESFVIERTVRGELLGHIPMGIELVNRLWHTLPLADWKELAPASEDVRIHLWHLLASHHGQLEFGAPVKPKTPEAATLHFIDNMDAQLDAYSTAYATAAEIAPGIFDFSRMVEAHPVASLRNTIK